MIGMAISQLANTIQRWNDSRTHSYWSKTYRTIRRLNGSAIRIFLWCRFSQISEALMSLNTALPLATIPQHTHQLHDLLVAIQSLLPGSIALNFDFHTSEYHFFSTPKVYAQLHHIAIMNREWFRLDAGLAESNMVEKCARRALQVLDVPLPMRAPKLAMSSTDYFGFESHWCRRWYIGRRIRVRIALRVSTNAYDMVFLRKSP